MFQVEEMALMKLLEQDSVNPQQTTMELFSKTSQVVGVPPKPRSSDKIIKANTIFFSQSRNVKGKCHY